MTTEQVLNFSRPVLFEDSGEEHYRYYGSGSALLFTWERHTYVVTARHVLRQGRDGQVRVPIDDVSLPFFLFDLAINPQGDDQDWKDLAFFRVDPRSDPAALEQISLPIRAADLRAATDYYTKERPLWVSGYPNSERSIDYGLAHIELQRCFIRAYYDRPDSAAEGKHQIRIDAPQLETFDGLSGSPVFVDRTPNLPLLAGILIQGTASSGSAHFLDTRVLGTLLSRLPLAPI